jgi:hypothetical protein
MRATARLIYGSLLARFAALRVSATGTPYLHSLNWVSLPTTNSLHSFSKFSIANLPFYYCICLGKPDINTPNPCQIEAMILRTIYLLAAALLSSLTLADVLVTGPEAGDTITGLTLDITWKDSGDSPALTDLASYQLFLCAGGNDEDNYVSQREGLTATADRFE